MRNFTIAAGLIAILIAVAATTAANPSASATSKKAAEVWVQRADRDLAKLTEDGSARYEVLEPNVLAVWTYQTSPTDARRAAAVKLIRQHVKDMQSIETDADSWRASMSRGARQLAEVDALGEANQMLAESQQPTTLPTTRPELKTTLDAVDALDRAYILVRLGRADDAGDVPLQFDRGTWFLEVLRDNGHDDDADAMDRLLQPTDAAAVHRADYFKARDLARAGFYEQALVTIENGNDPLIGCRTALVIGDLAFEAGALDQIPRVRQVVEKLVTDPKVVKPSPRVMLRDLLHLCGASGDQAGVDEVVDLVDQIPRTGTGNLEVDIDCEEAWAFTEVKEPDKATDALEKAIKAYDDLRPSTDERASADLWIAAVYGLQGDQEKMEKFKTAAFQDRPARPDNPQIAEYWNTDYGRLVIASLVAGHSDDALRIAKNAEPLRRPALLGEVVRDLVSHGKLEEARKVTADMPPANQGACYGMIAAEQVKAKKTDGLADWIDAIPTPQVRIAVDLSVANAITGWRNHDFEARLRVPRGW